MTVELPFTRPFACHQTVHMVAMEGKYKTWTPGPWTPSEDQVPGPVPSKYGPSPWSPFHGPGSYGPLFLLPVKIL